MRAQAATSAIIDFTPNRVRKSFMVASGEVTPIRIVTWDNCKLTFPADARDLRFGPSSGQPKALSEWSETVRSRAKRSGSEALSRLSPWSVEVG